MFTLIRMLFGMGSGVIGFLAIVTLLFLLVVSCQQDLEENGFTPLYKEFDRQLEKAGGSS